MSDRPPILPPALGLLTMLGIFVAHFINPVGILFAYPANYIALVPIALGATLNILADKELRNHNALGEQMKCSEPPRLLVSSGIYQYTRNPAYIGLLLIVIGLAIWVGSFSPWFVVLVFIALLNFCFVAKEEAALEARFGEKYKAYQRCVPRWVGLRRIE